MVKLSAFILSLLCVSIMFLCLNDGNSVTKWFTKGSLLVKFFSTWLVSLKLSLQTCFLFGTFFSISTAYHSKSFIASKTPVGFQPYVIVLSVNQVFKVKILICKPLNALHRYWRCMFKAKYLIHHRKLSLTS